MTQMITGERPPLNLRAGFLALFVFATLGLLLEALHGFKLGFYLDVDQETRRLLWRLGHAHGTLLGLLNIGYALAASAFGATVFLGGWSFFGLDKWIPPYLLLVGKVYLFYFVFIWTRGTLPRFRIDQLMTLAWKYLLPVALINLVLVATERQLWFEGDYKQYLLYVFAVVNIAAAVGILIGWAKVLGYKPEKNPTRARLVKNATGYVPLDSNSARVP